MKGQLLLYASLLGLAASLRPGCEPPRTGSRRAFTAALLAWPLAAERAAAATLQQQLLSKAGVDESKIATAQTTARSSSNAADAPRLVKPEKADFLKGTANNEELRAQRLAAYDEALASYEAAKKQVEVNGGRGLFANPFAEAEEVVSPEELARREQSFQQRKAATLAACRKSPPEPPDFECTAEATVQDKEAKFGFPLDQSQFEEYEEILRLKYYYLPGQIVVFQAEDLLVLLELRLVERESELGLLVLHRRLRGALEIGRLRRRFPAGGQRRRLALLEALLAPRELLGRHHLLRLGERVRKEAAAAVHLDLLLRRLIARQRLVVRGEPLSAQFLIVRRALEEVGLLGLDETWSVRRVAGRPCGRLRGRNLRLVDARLGEQLLLQRCGGRTLRSERPRQQRCGERATAASARRLAARTERRGEAEEAGVEEQLAFHLRARRS